MRRVRERERRRKLILLFSQPSRMEIKMWLPTITILCIGVCFGAPGAQYMDNNKADEGNEFRDLSSLEGEVGSHSDGPAAGPPASIFNIPDGWKPPSNEPCPVPIEVKQNFNVTRYLGVWYEIERFWNPFTEGGCVTAQYSLKEDGNIKVINSQGLRPADEEVEAIAVPADEGEGRLSVSFPESEAAFQSSQTNNYNILLTDYESYTVVYTCGTFRIPRSPVETKIEYSWILMRTPEPAVYMVEEIKDNIKRFFNIDSERYNPTNQENCPRLQLK